MLWIRGEIAEILNDEDSENGQSYNAALTDIQILPDPVFTIS